MRLRCHLVYITVIFFAACSIVIAKSTHKHMKKRNDKHSKASLRATGLIGIGEGIAHMIGATISGGANLYSALIGAESEENGPPPPSVFSSTGEIFNNMPPMPMGQPPMPMLPGGFPPMGQPPFPMPPGGFMPMGQGPPPPPPPPPPPGDLPMNSLHY